MANSNMQRRPFSSGPVTYFWEGGPTGLFVSGHAISLNGSGLGQNICLTDGLYCVIYFGLWLN